MKKKSRSGFKMKGFSYPGVSPNKQVETEKTEEELDNQVNTSSDSEDIAEDIVKPPKVNKTKTITGKVGNTLVGAFTSGLDAVYGTGKVLPKGSKIYFQNKDKDKKEKSLSDVEKSVDDKINS